MGFPPIGLLRYFPVASKPPFLTQEGRGPSYFRLPISPSPYLPVTLSPRHPVAPSPHRPVAPSPRLPVAPSPRLPIPLPLPSSDFPLTC
jgi:hypothetical protein